MYMLVLFLFFRYIKYACTNFKLFYQKKKKKFKTGTSRMEKAKRR